MYLTLTKNNIINNQNLNDLGYYPIIPLSYVWGHITGKYNSSYINTVKTVYNRVNYNISKWNTIPFVETVSYENVDEVINGYGNIVVSDETIEQWQPNRFNAVEQQRTYRLVQKASGVSAKYVKMILDELYWATKDGEVVENKWIRPREFKEYIEYRQQNKATKGNEWFSNTIDVTKWLLILAGIGIAGYLLFNLYNASKIAR